MGNGILGEVCSTHCIIMKGMILYYSLMVSTPLTTVYDKCGYCDVVEKVTKESMQKAVEEVKGGEGYDSCGEVIMLCLHW